MKLSAERFCNVDLNDEFFDSLKSDYAEFTDWFNRKSIQNDSAYIFYNDKGGVEGFLYLKSECESIDDVEPPLPKGARLKIGTMKINPHGTRLGERFIKKAFDHAVANNLEEIYVTVFSKHEALVSLFKRYGFVEAGSKKTDNGTELVLVKVFDVDHRDSLLNYPKIDVRKNRNYLLALWPDFHTQLLPDSILSNEKDSILKDVSHTNSIHKIYLTKMAGTENLKRGDNLLIYRTSDQQGPAYYRAVATSVCVVEEVKSIFDFASEQDFHKYCSAYSIFNDNDLKGFYRKKNYPTVIRFSYNLAFTKRIIRGELIDKFGISSGQYWGFFELDPALMRDICIEGGVNESLIVDKA